MKEKNYKSFDAIVIGEYGTGNLGDDILMCSILIKLFQIMPHARIGIIIKKDNSYIRRWFPKVHLISLAEGLKENYQTEFLIYGGGTQFFSFANLESIVIAYSRQVVRIIRSPRCYFLSKLQQYRNVQNTIFAKHKAGISLGIGPFCGIFQGKIEKKTRTLLAEFEWLSVRDFVSAGFLEKWGKVPYDVFPDLCYSISSWLDIEIVHKMANSKPKNEHCRVGVIIRDWAHSREGRAYWNPLFDAVRMLREEGTEVAFISFAEQYDVNSILELKRRNEVGVIAWNPEFSELNKFINSLNSFDIILSSRAHGLILSSVLGIKSIGIEIEPKIRVLQQSIEGCLLWEKPFNPHQLVKIVKLINVSKIDQERLKFEEDFISHNANLADKSLNSLADWMLMLRSNRSK